MILDMQKLQQPKTIAIGVGVGFFASRFVDSLLVSVAIGAAAAVAATRYMGGCCAGCTGGAPLTAHASLDVQAVDRDEEINSDDFARPPKHDFTAFQVFGLGVNAAQSPRATNDPVQTSSGGRGCS